MDKFQAAVTGGDENHSESREWETLAGAWLRSFPDVKAVSTKDVETWINANYSLLPLDLQYMPRSQLIDRLLSIQNYMRLPKILDVGGSNQVDVQQARFQRTDQWLPVYSWLESLDKDELVKSKDISDWLSNNPDIEGQLCAKHSRYHLMHYIKKCHLKILKRKEKKAESQKAHKSSQPFYKIVVDGQTPLPSQTTGVAGKAPATVLHDGGDSYMAKRVEALHKYYMW